MTTVREQGYYDALEKLGMSHNKSAGPGIQRAAGMLRSVGGRIGQGLKDFGGKVKGMLGKPPTPGSQLRGGASPVPPKQPLAPHEIMGGPAPTPTSASKSTVNRLDSMMGEPAKSPISGNMAPRQTLGGNTAKPNIVPNEKPGWSKDTPDRSGMLSNASTAVSTIAPGDVAQAGTDAGTNAASDAAGNSAKGLLDNKMVRWGAPAAAIGGGMYMMNRGGQPVQQESPQPYYGGGGVAQYPPQY